MIGRLLDDGDLRAMPVQLTRGSGRKIEEHEYLTRLQQAVKMFGIRWPQGA
jgi:hypothetical protein